MFKHHTIESATGWPSWRAAVMALCLGLGLLTGATAKQAEPVATDQALEARVMTLSAELRCLVCQNQTIADSHAELAVDLRNQVRTMMAKGQSDDEIRSYMTARYGDFVLYKPPLKASTALLWVGPPLLLVGALAGLFLMLRARQRANPEAFDADTPDGDAERFPDPLTAPLPAASAGTARPEHTPAHGSQSRDP